VNRDLRGFGPVTRQQASSLAMKLAALTHRDVPVDRLGNQRMHKPQRLPRPEDLRCSELI
jgi:hypothetical protein